MQDRERLGNLLYKELISCDPQSPEYQVWSLAQDTLRTTNAGVIGLWYQKYNAAPRKPRKRRS